jgi:hypothetical protein
VGGAEVDRPVPAAVGLDPQVAARHLAIGQHEIVAGVAPRRDRALQGDGVGDPAGLADDQVSHQSSLPALTPGRYSRVG